MPDQSSTILLAEQPDWSQNPKPIVQHAHLNVVNTLLEKGANIAAQIKEVCVQYPSLSQSANLPVSSMIEDSLL